MRNLDRAPQVQSEVSINTQEVRDRNGETLHRSPLGWQNRSREGSPAACHGARLRSVDLSKPLLMTEENKELETQPHAADMAPEGSLPEGEETIAPESAPPPPSPALGSEASNHEAVAALMMAKEALEAEREAAQAQLEDLKAQHARLAADFDNFRKRTAKEKEELEVRIKANLLKELLTVVDNFERARSQVKPQTDEEMTIHKSYQGIYKQMVDCFKRLGVAPMRPEGQPFDPNLHEAVMRETTSEHPEDTVIEELMRGYLLGDRVLRHAMVKVAAAPDDAPSGEAGGESEPAEPNPEAAKLTEGR